MKKRGKIIRAALAAAILLILAYLSVVKLVMPDFYRGRLPEHLAAHVVGAGLFEVELANLEFEQTLIERATLKFRPGRDHPCAVILDGMNLNCRLAPDHGIYINDTRLDRFFASLRPRFGDFPLSRLKLTNCRLPQGPPIALEVRFFSTDWRRFEATLKSLDRKTPFQLEIAAVDNESDNVKISLSGSYSLPVLLQALKDFKLVQPPEDITVSGHAELDGHFTIARDTGKIGNHRLNGRLKDAIISSAAIRLVSEPGARFSYINRTLNASNFRFEAPGHYRIKDLALTMPENDGTIRFSGTGELSANDQYGFRLISAGNLAGAFEGTCKPESKLWTAWAASTLNHGEAVFKGYERLIELKLTRYEWSANGRGLDSGDFNLALAASGVRVSSPQGNQAFSDAALNLNAKFGGDAKNLNINGKLTLGEAAGNDFKLSGLTLDGRIEGMPGNLLLNIAAKAESIGWKMFTLEQVEGGAGLDNGKITVNAGFNKASADTGPHKFFSPQGKIQLTGTRKNNLYTLKGSLETAELWYLSEALSGKLDRVKLAADIDPADIALRLDAPEGNAEGGGAKLHSAEVSGNYFIRYNQAMQRWEPDRLLSNLQIKDLEVSSDAVIALFPSAHLTPGNLTLRNADVTLGHIQLQKISLRQRLPGDGELNIGQVISGGHRHGAFKGTTAADKSSWRFKGGHSLAALNKAVMNFAGSLDWPELGPRLEIACRMPGFNLPQPVALSMLNPDWKDIRFSGGGSLHGKFAISASRTHSQVAASLKNASVYGKNWAADTINGNLKITDLERNSTAPHQTLSFANMIIGGYELSRGTMILHAENSDKFRLEHAEFDCLGGRFTTTAPVVFDPRDEVKISFLAESVNLPPLLLMLGIPEASGSARASGTVPVVFSNHRAGLHNARLTGHNGTLRLSGLDKFNAGAPRELIRNGNLPFIQAVLQDFIYRDLEVTLNPGVIRFHGRGRPAANVPFRYDSAGQRFVRVEAIDGIGSELEIDTEIRL